MADALEEKIWKTQYGFRRKHSTNQALYLVRRLQDISEAAGDKMMMLFLDWEKAFDKVDQQQLLKAIKRLNVPDKIMLILESFYVNPQFRVKDREGKSSYRKQRSGIRQGCPLSPYLFVLLMTVLFHDVHQKVDHRIRIGQIEYFSHWELLYADDTLLLGKRAREINILLHAIEEECETYNLKLNRGKCEYIGMHGKADIKFKNGVRVKHASESVYLGSKIAGNGSREAEIQHRLSKALLPASRLKFFWK